MPPTSISHSTLLIIFFLSPLSALNITTLLSSYPYLSDFTSLLSATQIPADLTQRSSLTILAVPNTYLRPPYLTHLPSPSSLPDVLRYHVLLQFLSFPDLRRLPPNGILVTTLFQTTGRAPDINGAVNLTVTPNGSVTVRSPTPFSPSNATILSVIKTIPYNLTIFTVNSLLIPPNFDLTASENRPPVGLNITQVLIDARNFNVAASMLIASGVVEEFEADEKGAGITVFVPTDSAFAELPLTERLQSLPAEQKAVVLKFHVLHSYYPLGSLESIVNPVQPTLATEDVGAGHFTLSITRINGSVAIGTGIVQASITQTVFDQNPVAIFAVSRVLLPKDMFGKEGPVVGLGRGAAPPEIGVAPESPGVAGAQTPPTRLSSPPGFGVIRSDGGDRRAASTAVAALFCIGLYLMV
ncbi:fasciclin-like arabinogalactan protein 4 [Magnolia sinica]|uniref:fasciclin-like arabinogalactan protein 4 n=1 Tax=Magnolia sinica TaxID=86752 RepID=UPI0026592E5D|nr:fasciclin-like arabinogalactan protein 4 [Magnolia sinica]